MQHVFHDVPNMGTVLSSLSLISEPFKDLPFQRFTDHSSKHRIDDKRNNRLENHRQLQITYVILLSAVRLLCLLLRDIKINLHTE